MQLTDQQLEAVTSDNPYTIVVAGAGAGKTTMLAARVAWLVENGEPPDSILALVFTRMAASHLRKRIEAACPEARGAWISTLHSFAATRLAEGERVASDADVAAVFQSLYKGRQRLTTRRRPAMRKLERSIMRHEAGLDHDDGEALEVMRQRLREQARVLECGATPSWDLVPLALRGRLPHFRHVLVDEYQDCTPNEAAMVSELRGVSLTAVGDPRQSIFTWRGGSPEAIPNCWPTQEARIIQMSKCHRFGPELAARANMVSDALEFSGITGEGPAGSVETIEGSVSEAVAKIGEPGKTAILCRTNMECAEIEAELGGLAVHVKRDPTVPLHSAADEVERVEKLGQVAICTVHTSKGLEWDHVIVVWHQSYASGKKEDIRTLYVALTRSRKTLLELRREGIQA